MGSVLNPDTNGKYFDEIRSLMAPDHLLDEADMPNTVIDQYSYLGRSELEVLEALSLDASDLAVSDDTPNVIPSTPAGQKKRQYVWVIQALTAYKLLQPQVISEEVNGELAWKYETYSMEDRRQWLTTQIRPILPQVLNPSEPSDDGKGGADLTQIVSVTPAW